MSVNEIVERLKSDPAFAARYQNLNSVSAIKEQAQADGLSLSDSDIRAVIAKLQGGGGELSESQLAMVAGGADDDKVFCSKCGAWIDKKYWDFHKGVCDGS